MENLESRIKFMEDELKYLKSYIREKKELSTCVWYKGQNGSMLYFTGKDGEEYYGYGWDYKGVWRDEQKWLIPSNDDNFYILAEDYEVESRLLKEMHKRYKNGDRVNCRIGGMYCIKLELYPNVNILERGICIKNRVNEDGVWIYKDGLWAEKIETSGLPVINGYSGIEEGDYIIYGCRRFHKKDLYPLDRLNISSFNIYDGDKEITISKEQTSELKNFLNQ